MRQLYTPRNEPMSVVVLFSGGASSLRSVLADSNYGKLYCVTGTYTDEEGAKGRALCKEHAIQDLFLSRKGFYQKIL